MATTETLKRTYPTMPVRQWWALRERFRKTIPSVVSSSFVASALSMGDKSASANILPTLRLAGIIDEDGKPTDRAVKWRDDASYPKLCETLRQELYPNELLDLAPDPSTDRREIERWFAHATGFGEAAVKKMAAFYQLLVEADPEKAKTAPVSNGKKKTQRTATPRRATSRASARREVPEPTRGAARLDSALHLNIQIHLSPEMSPEQIDHVFASMARHLKDLL